MCFRFAVTLGLALGLFNCAANAQNSITVLPTDKIQPIPVYNRSTVVPVDTELQLSIRDSAKRLRASKSNDEATRESFKLTQLLEQDYEARLADYQKDLDQLDEKLKSMKEKLERKRNAKADMIKLRIEVLKAEAGDLGWPSPVLAPGSFRTMDTNNNSWPAPFYTSGVSPAKQSGGQSHAEVDKLIEEVLIQHSKDYQKLSGNSPFVSADAAEVFKNHALKKLPPFSELSRWQIQKINSGFQHPAEHLQSEADKQVSKALAYRRKEWDKLKEAGPTTTMDKIEAVRDKTLEILPPFSKLDPRQIRKVATSGLLQNGPARIEAISELEKYTEDESLDGAFAAYQLFVFAVEYPMTGYPKDESKPMRIARQRVCFERFLNHPHRKLLFEMDRKLGLFSSIRQFDSPQIWKEFKTELFLLYHSFLKEQKARMTDLVDCFEILKTIADEDEKKDIIDIVRLKLIEHGNKCLSILEGENTLDSKIQIQHLKGQILQLEKVSDEGTLLGTDASPLEIIWSSSDQLASWKQLKGKVSVLYFATPSCGPCVKSVPKLINVNHQLPKNINFVGITNQEGFVPLKRGVIKCPDDLGKETELLKEYMAESKINWSILISEESVFNASFGVRSVPHMVILDAKGVIRDMFNPYLVEEASILKRIAAVTAD